MELRKPDTGRSGVSMSIGSTDPLDEKYLDDLVELVRDVDPAIVSDHLCWASLGGHTVHDLCPMPYTEESLDHLEQFVRTLRVVREKKNNRKRK